MKKNRLLSKLMYLACLCLSFAFVFFATPAITNAASNEGLKISVKVHSPNQNDISVGPGKKSTVIQTPGGAYVLNTVKKSNSSDYVYESIFFDGLASGSNEFDFTRLPFVGTKFTLTHIDLPDGYVMEYTTLPMEKTFSLQLYSQMLQDKKNNKPVQGEIVFNVYVRPVGTKPNLANARIQSAEDLIYNGKAQNFKGKLVYHDTVLVEGKDYVIECSNNINPGKAKVRFKGIGNFAGTELTSTYNILSVTMDDKNTTVSKIPAQPYTGKDIRPSLEVTVNGRTLNAGTDYFVQYIDNIEVGKATVHIIGKGGYQGTYTTYFEIKQMLPAKNEIITVGTGKYRVLNSSATNGTVIFMAPTSTKYRSFTVPSTITYNGYRFKVTMIYAKAFRYNRYLTSVKIGKYVDTIGSYAFYGDSRLKSIEITGTELKKVGKSIFKGIYSKATIKVPYKRLRTYGRLLKDKGQSSRVQIVK